VASCVRGLKLYLDSVIFFAPVLHWVRDVLSKISGFHGGGYEEYRLLGCGVV
jgi:hypothetical protein